MLRDSIAHIIIIDDPISPAMSMSDKGLVAVNEWMDSTINAYNADSLHKQASDGQSCKSDAGCLECQSAARSSKLPVRFYSLTLVKAFLVLPKRRQQFVGLPARSGNSMFVQQAVGAMFGNGIYLQKEISPKITYRHGLGVHHLYRCVCLPKWNYKRLRKATLKKKEKVIWG